MHNIFNVRETLLKGSSQAILAMFNLFPEYQLKSLIHESVNSFIYRGYRESDRQPVILKVLKPDYCTPSELARYQREYNITRHLNLDGIVKAYKLERYQNTLVMVLEDFGGKSLKLWLEEQRFTLSDFLTLSIQIADILGQIHAAGIIHRDLNPANILFNPESEQVKLIDFGIATGMLQENTSAPLFTDLEGTLAYISPEQTGRMNRSVDYRTDFYSLGVTFYELLTGRLPFESNDTMELIHAHIALTPIPPHQRNSEIPKAVSDIVMKLLAKTAEMRYQSAWGIQADLVLCLMQLEANGLIEDLVPGENDVAYQFQVSAKVYGREAEIKTLISTFENIARNSKSDSSSSDVKSSDRSVEIAFISGYAGSGKSTLIAELYRTFSPTSGHLISGRFSSTAGDRPYSALIDALQELVRQLLTETEEELEAWRVKIDRAIGDRSQVLIEAIPELKLIIGEPNYPRKSDFKSIFKDLLQVFLFDDYSLAICLDNLRWIDRETLQLLEECLLDNRTRNVLVIGAYRSKEVSEAHPLSLAIERLRQQNIPIHIIHLNPLDLDAIVQLITDTLQSEKKSVKSLAALILQKTYGNPFFIHEFLKTLYAEKVLVFDEESLSWQWDLARIESMEIAENVVGFTLAQLKNLPDCTQHALGLGACLGNPFDVRQLARLQQQSETDVFKHIFPALQIGIIQPIVTETQSLDSSVPQINYQFIHPQLQKAAKSIFDSTTQKQIHFKIGMLLLEEIPKSQHAQHIFEIVNHWNFSIDLIVERRDKIKLVELNLEAAKQAKEQMKPKLARDYLEFATSIAPEEIWVDCHDLVFELHKEQAEIEYLNGNWQHSQVLVNFSIDRARNALERASFENILIAQYTLSGQYDRAIECGKNSLQSLNINFPTDRGLDFWKNELANLPFKQTALYAENWQTALKMSDLSGKIGMKILRNLESPTAFVEPRLFVATIATMMKLSLTSGLTPESSTAYAAYGVLQNLLMGNPQLGYELAQCGVRLSEQFGSMAYKCQTSMRLGAQLAPWTQSLSTSIAILNEGYQAGLQANEFQFSGYILVHKLLLLFAAGTNLDILLSEIPKFLGFCQNTHNQWAIDAILATQFPILNLCGQTQGKLEFHNGEMWEAEYIENCQQNRSFSALGIYFIHKLQVLYLYEKYAAALQASQAAEPFLETLLSTFAIAEHQFFTALSLAALYPTATPQKRKIYWQQIESIQAQLQTWEQNCPENFQHLVLIIAAEMAILSGDKFDAIDLYDRAILLATKREFMQHAAIANERLAKFWLDRHKDKIAKLYLEGAYHNYQQWGATRKVEALEKNYPALLTLDTIVFPNALISSGEIDPKLTLTVCSLQTHIGALDLATVTRAAQMLSGEIVLSQLLDKLMQTIIAHAGATSGYLILSREEGLTIEAVKMAGSDRVALQQSTPVKESDRLPLSLINYVARTQETIVFQDAEEESIFATDPYIQRQQPQSVLCAPIQGQGKLIGLVYLENNLTRQAFTSDRLDVLLLLCAQAAIALENACLYQNLQQSELRERDKATQLEQSLQNLKDAQIKLIQGEKMAALGQLVAGIAHEINNPVGCIAGNIDPLRSYFEDLIDLIELYRQMYPEPTAEIADTLESVDLEFLQDDLPKIFDSMSVSIERIRQISRSLRTFSRSDESVKVSVDLHEGIESTLMILKHRLKANSDRPEIEIIRNYGNLPTIECFAGQLNQVFMNIVSNAIEALEESNQGKTYLQIQQQPNQIRISTTLDPKHQQAIVRIADNGPGMSAEIQKQVFEHLFTTKPVGKGTGLGLSISRQIVVEKHGGHLHCESALGEGTTFIVEIPVQ
jgi:predicted ATPase/signal transduction histidine kinase